MSVQVAVRVRPFNKREIELGTELCVEMRGNRTTLKSLDDVDKDKDFYFDYSFWSFDGFKELANGIMVPENDLSPYADQYRVYNTVGKKILDNAWQGFHCSLFAYGQTGAGKSYSVMGYGVNVGIVPIACEEIFKRIDQDKGDDKKQYEVTLGMLEIYNEKVQDLQIPVEKRPAAGMKIRESQSIGFYAEDLRKVPVRNFKEIEQRMEQGNTHRSVGATLMNATSSRAHTVIIIEFKQILIEVTPAGQTKKEKLSIINLVDLAGSEKVGKTGASGDRLKEASNINKSLSMLGMVIMTLAENDSGSKKKVPYRDSALTKILANALGGNSKTVMICAISPAQDNYEESLSTLRYADQAKKIKNKAVINESATDKLIRELKEENDKLKKDLDKFQNLLDGNIDPSDPKYKQMMELRAMLNANQKAIDASKMSAEEKLKEIDDELAFEKVDTSKPYLANLNEDPSLDMKVLYTLDRPQTRVGRKRGENELEVILNGVGVKPDHCRLVNEKGKVFLVPGQDDNIYDFLFLNGEKVAQKVQVMNNDRIFIGTSAAFVVKLPKQESRKGAPAEKDINYIFAYDERKKKEEEEREREQQEMERKMKMSLEERLAEMVALHNLKVAKIKSETEEMEKSYESRVKSLMEGNQKVLEEEQDKLNQLKRMTSIREKDEAEKKKKKFEYNIKQALEKISDLKERKRLEKMREELEPKIDEMNIMSEELGRDIRFVLKLVDDDVDKMQVFVENKERGATYVWDLEKALNRYDLVKQNYNNQNQGGEEGKLGEDGLDTENDRQPIGKCGVILQPLNYLIDNPSQIWILDEITGAIRGYLRASIYPVSYDHNEETQIDPYQNLCREGKRIKNPEKELQDKSYKIKVHIEEAYLPPGITELSIRYVLKNDLLEEKAFDVPVKEVKNQTQYVFGYQKEHDYKNFGPELLKHFRDKTLTFKFSGKNEANRIESIPVWLGQKERDIQVLTGDKNRLKAKIEEEKKIEAENKLALRLKQIEERLMRLSQLRWIPVAFFGLLSLTLFVIHLSFLSKYRANYDQMISSNQQRLVTEGKNNMGFWRSYSVTLIGCSVMIGYYGLSILGMKCMRRFFKELIYVSMFPFGIWGITSLIWLCTNTYYQNQQLLAEQQQEPGGTCSDLTSANPYFYSCKMAISFYELYVWTIFILILNLIIYLFYYISLLKYIQDGLIPGVSSSVTPLSNKVYPINNNSVNMESKQDESDRQLYQDKSIYN